MVTKLAFMRITNKVVPWPSGLCVELRSWRPGFDPG